MKNSRFSCWLTFFVLASIPASLSAHTTLGYSSETVEKGKGFRLSANKDQRMAIRLSNNKVQALKGETIAGFRAAFGTKNATNAEVKFFITTSLEEDPLCQQAFQLSNSTYSFSEYNLEQGYLITGEEPELYVGCMMNVASNLAPFTADFSQDLKETFFAYGTDGWQDLYGKGYGAPNLEILVADDSFALTDLVVKSFKLDGFLKAESVSDYSFEIQNFGTQSVQSFVAELYAGDDCLTSIPVDCSTSPVPSHALYHLAIPEVAMPTVGLKDVRIAISQVNGGDFDADVSDNEQTASAYFYPSATEKNVLVEVFTGQTCTNCPTGHSAIATSLEQTGIAVVELEHHAGFVEDAFSMNEDWSLTSLYGGVTYAPAMMLDRMVLSSEEVPVVECTSVSSNKSYLTEAAAQKPYVSVALESQLDEQNREVAVTAHIYTHEALPGDSVHCSMWLVQDSIVAFQSGGDASYVHRYVSRGAITAGAWGEPVTLPVGEVVDFQRRFVLPDTIVSTYHHKASIDPNIATDLAQMKLVVFVHQYDAQLLAGNRVFNSIASPVGKTVVQGGFPADSYLEQVGGNGSSRANIFIYNVSGQLVKILPHDQFDVNLLPLGMSIVRFGDQLRRFWR